MTEHPGLTGRAPRRLDPTNPWPGDGSQYLPASLVRRRYGNVSDMWVQRRLTDGSGFPKPTMIAGRRFWRVRDLEEWELTLRPGQRESDNLPD